MDIKDKIDLYLNEADIKKITKKKFMSLHKSGELGLIAGSVMGDAKHIISSLKNVNLSKIELMKTTNINVGSQTSIGTSIIIYETTQQDKIFYIIESRFDNSKNRNVSWDTIDYYCTVYMKKE